jgi:hypothetical protein
MPSIQRAVDAARLCCDSFTSRLLLPLLNDVRVIAESHRNRQGDYKPECNVHPSPFLYAESGCEGGWRTF